jgi:hypothetical protein
MRECAQPGCTELVERGRCKRHTHEVTAAVAAYHEAHQDASEGTKRNRRRALRFFEEFASARGLQNVDQIYSESLNAFRGSRPLSARTSTKKLEILRHFFGFCAGARDGSTVALYRAAYRRPGDAGKGTDQGRRDFAHYQNGKAVRLPVHRDLQAALDVLPYPEGPTARTAAICSGVATDRSARFIRDVTRTMATAYQASGVAGACSHRFRHTLATEILELGGTFEDAADVLGDSETIVRKHLCEVERRKAGQNQRFTEAPLARVRHADSRRLTNLSE